MQCNDLRIWILKIWNTIYVVHILFVYIFFTMTRFSTRRNMVRLGQAAVQGRGAAQQGLSGATRNARFLFL